MSSNNLPSVLVGPAYQEVHHLLSVPAVPDLLEVPGLLVSRSYHCCLAARGLPSRQEYTQNTLRPCFPSDQPSLPYQADQAVHLLPWDQVGQVYQEVQEFPPEHLLELLFLLDNLVLLSVLVAHLFHSSNSDP